MDADLARALVALPGWEWRAGMRDTAGRIVLRVRGGRPVVRSALGEPDGLSEWADALPDLDDAATGGCLLAMLWEADPAGFWCVDRESTTSVGVHDVPSSGEVERYYSAPTLGRVCAAALVAIWRCA